MTNQFWLKRFMSANSNHLEKNNLWSEFHLVTEYKVQSLIKAEQNVATRPL